LTCEDTPGLVGGRASRGRGSCWSGLRGECELVDPGRDVDFQGAEDVALGLGDLGALPKGAGGAGEGADVDPVELVAQVRPGVAAGVLGDPREEKCQPAQDDVGADALFLAVVDRVLATSLFGDVAAALREHGSATLDEH